MYVAMVSRFSRHQPRRRAHRPVLGNVGFVIPAEAPLDGNGDGVWGDDYVLASSGSTCIARLFGDADGKGPSIFDSDGDGDTDNVDFVGFRSRFGTMVP